MRKLIVALLIACAGMNAWAQGTVFFANRVAPNVAPVYDVDGTTALLGTGFSAQLFAGAQGTGENALTPVGSPVPFRTTASVAGTWSGIQEIIPGVAGGAIATMQVRAWANAGGTLTSYAAALLAGSPAGKSTVFDSLALGNTAVTPATLPPNIVGNPLAANNLQSFSLVPEPSVIALGALGAVALLLRRRKA